MKNKIACRYKLQRLIFSSFLCLIILTSSNQAFNIKKEESNTDTLIKALAWQINSDSIRANMQALQDFGTRLSFLQEQSSKAAIWLKNKLYSYGYSDIQADSFECTMIYYGNGVKSTTNWQRNIIVTIPGKTRPEDVIILGAHYDSYSKTLTGSAPGADDNASGTGAVLEIARILKQNKYQPESTVKLILFCAEELMRTSMSGSVTYALKAKYSGQKISLMINLDMIGYSPVPVSESSLKFEYYTGFEYLLDEMFEYTRKYTKLTPVKGTGDLGADSAPFAQFGFPAIFLFEDKFNPYYHTSEDVISNCNIEYCTEAARAGLSILISRAQGTLTSAPRYEKKVNPSGIFLMQNYPNPFNSSTTISYYLVKPSNVKLKIIDILGNQVTETKEKPEDSGFHSLYFDASSLPSGMYIYQVEADGIRDTKKMLLLK
ncbi:MAG: M20/M25/M40 family metallo-hydrolase [Bacillota bacterium]